VGRRADQTARVNEHHHELLQMGRAYDARGDGSHAAAHAHDAADADDARALHRAHASSVLHAHPRHAAHDECSPRRALSASTRVALHPPPTLVAQEWSTCSVGGRTASSAWG
jgi:hypothetical protein